MIIIYKEIKNGKIELTKEELEDLLKQAEQEGYARGCATHCAYISPVTSGTYGGITNCSGNDKLLKEE